MYVCIEKNDVYVQSKDRTSHLARQYTQLFAPICVHTHTRANTKDEIINYFVIATIKRRQLNAQLAQIETMCVISGEWSKNNNNRSFAWLLTSNNSEKWPEKNLLARQSKANVCKIPLKLSILFITALPLAQLNCFQIQHATQICSSLQ